MLSARPQSKRVQLDVPLPTERVVLRAFACRPLTPNTAYADATTAQQATLMASRAARGRPKSASAVPGRPVSPHDFDAIEHTVPFRSTHEKVRAVRLEVAPFLLSRYDLVNAKQVNLRAHELGSSGAATLSIALVGGALHQCEDLDLGGNHMGDTGLEALSYAIGGGALPRLTSLYLCGNDFGDDGMTHLATSFRRRGGVRLEALYLGRNQVGDAGAMALASSCSKSRGLTRCRLLQLSHNQFGDAGLAALAAAATDRGAWPALDRLWLNHNSYFEDGSAALAKAIDAGGWPALRELHTDDPEALQIVVTGLKAACDKRSISRGAGRVFQHWKVAPKRYLGGGKLKPPPGT